MAIPGFQTWFLPLLKRLADGEIHLLRDLYQGLADDLGLNEEERQQLLPSGKQLLYRNRIGWARTYLKNAGLLETPGRSQSRITDRGREVLAAPPPDLNVKFLKQYEEFRNFHTYKRPTAKSDPIDPAETGAETPEELLERAHNDLKTSVTGELLDRVKGAPPEFFEQLVVDLLVKMGYGGSREDAGSRVGGSGDGGVDGIINEDRLGLDLVYIQAKRWEGTVGRPVVQAFAGSLEGFRAKKGVLLTTSDFSSGAREYVEQIEKRIVLVDGRQLADLMFEYDLGASPVADYSVKRVDIDFFEES